jgi:glycine hydroxymethyltransferase
MRDLRLGLQEATRRGVEVDAMLRIARFLRRVVLEGEDPVAVGAEVRALRRRYTGVQYCF